MPTIVPFLRQNGQSLDAIHQNWCAAFVNGVLSQRRRPACKGPAKNIATSFLNWGSRPRRPTAGDVLVQPKGATGRRHRWPCRIATGHITEGNGQVCVLMQSGNYGGNGGHVRIAGSRREPRGAPRHNPHNRRRSNGRRQRRPDIKCGTRLLREEARAPRPWKIPTSSLAGR
jgi:hypothetical protein